MANVEALCLGCANRDPKDGGLSLLGLLGEIKRKEQQQVTVRMPGSMSVAKFVRLQQLLLVSNNCKSNFDILKLHERDLEKSIQVVCVYSYYFYFRYEFGFIWIPKLFKV